MLSVQPHLIDVFAGDVMWPDANFASLAHELFHSLDETGHYGVARRVRCCYYFLLLLPRPLRSYSPTSSRAKTTALAVPAVHSVGE